MSCFTRHILPATLIAGVLLSTALLGHAQASQPVCEYHAPETWLPMAEIEAFAATLDVQHYFIQAEAGCWGVFYTDADGKAWELLLDPATGLGEVLRPS